MLKTLTQTTDSVSAHPFPMFRTLLSPAAGGAWLLACAGLGWSLHGVAGLMLGPIVGIAMGAMLGRERQSSLGAAIGAGAIAGVLLLIGTQTFERQERTQLQTATQSNDSLIAAIADEIALENFAREKTPAESRAEAAQGALAPFAATRETISPEVWQQAEDRWNALDPAEQEEIRRQRERWINASQGPTLERHDTGPGWLSRTIKTLAVAGLASVTTLVTPRLLAASSPDD